MNTNPSNGDSEFNLPFSQAHMHISDLCVLGSVVTGAGIGLMWGFSIFDLSLYGFLRSLVTIAGTTLISYGIGTLTNAIVRAMVWAQKNG